jgi:hypothetical protein
VNRRGWSGPSGQDTSIEVVRRSEFAGRGGAGLAVVRGAGGIVSMFIVGAVSLR